MDPQINLDGSIFHKGCAKCNDCNCQISLSNFTKNENDGIITLLCKTHYFKRFHEQGSYLGGEKFAIKNPRDEKTLGTTTAATAVPSVSSSVDEIKPTYNVKLKSTPKKEASVEIVAEVHASVAEVVAGDSVEETRQALEEAKVDGEEAVSLEVSADNIEQKRETAPLTLSSTADEGAAV